MALGFRGRSHRRSHSDTPSTSSSSSDSTSAPTPTSAHIHEATRLQPGAPRRVAIVGTGREALALSPNSANQFSQSLNMAVCSSPEINVQFANLVPNPNPGPVRELRRIASDVAMRPVSTSSASSFKLASSSKPPRGLPPPPRPNRRRPPPVLVTTLGAPLAVAEQDAPTPRASSVPPSAASSSFWGCQGQKSARAQSLRTARSYASHMGSSSISTVTATDSDADVDLDGLDAEYDEYDFSDDEDVGKSPLGGTYFPPQAGRGVRPLRVQVSIEQVAFRDGSPCVRHFPPRWEEDGVKTRMAVEDMPRTKRSLGKALGRWWRKHT